MIEFYAGREQEIHYLQSRQSPSPTHKGHHPQRLDYVHRRRDSDTLRSLAPSLGSTGSGSPTVMDSQRVSPPLSARLQSRYSPPSSSVSTSRGRVSPPAAAKGRVSPPSAKGRLSNQIGREVAKHRRSPTAPEAPTTSGMMRDPNAPVNGVGKTWAGAGVDRAEREDDYECGGVASSGEKDRERERERDKDRERERERERDRERERKGHQSQMSLQQQQQYSQSAPSLSVAPTAPAQLNRHIVVSLSFVFVLGDFTEAYFIGEQKKLCSIGYDRKRRVITRLPCS